MNFLAQFIQFIAKNEALHSHAHFQEFIKPHVCPPRPLKTLLSVA